MLNKIDIAYIVVGVFSVGLGIGSISGAIFGDAKAEARAKEAAMGEVTQCRFARDLGLPENCKRVERLAGLRPMSELCQSFFELDAMLKEQNLEGIGPEVIAKCEARII